VFLAFISVLPKVVKLFVGKQLWIQLIVNGTNFKTSIIISYFLKIK